MASIEDVDGDSCHDISVDQKAGASIETTIKFAQGFTIPCTDFGGEAEEGIRTAKIQICSSYRTAADDYSCDVNGPSPCGPDSCWCDTIDLGVEIVSEEIVESTYAVDDSMEACANTALSMNVIYNDVYPADSPLKLNNIIENGEYGSCAIAGTRNKFIIPNLLRFMVLLLEFYSFGDVHLSHILASSLQKMLDRWNRNRSNGTWSRHS